MAARATRVAIAIYFMSDRLITYYILLIDLILVLMKSNTLYKKMKKEKIIEKKVTGSEESSYKV
jgi:hypothetical protein